MNISRKAVLLIAALADIAIIAGAGITAYVMTQNVVTGIIAGLVAAIVIVSVDMISKKLLVGYLVKNPASMPTLRRFLGL